MSHMFQLFEELKKILWNKQYGLEATLTFELKKNTISLKF